MPLTIKATEQRNKTVIGKTGNGLQKLFTGIAKGEIVFR
jgi:hypothetical protein